MGTEKQRQRRCDGARLTESGNTRSEQLNTHGAHRVANQQSFGLPEWIRTLKDRLVFRYEISDLFLLLPISDGLVLNFVNLSWWFSHETTAFTASSAPPTSHFMFHKVLLTLSTRSTSILAHGLYTCSAMCQYIGTESSRGKQLTRQAAKPSKNLR